MSGTELAVDYHLIQRNRKSGVVLYAGIPIPGTRKYSQMLQLATAPAETTTVKNKETGEEREVLKPKDRKRRDKEAHVEILELQKAGKIGYSTGIASYLLTFWDFEKSEYIRSKRAEGRNISPDYCRANRRLIKNHFLPFMETQNVETLADLSKKNLLQWRNELFESGTLSAVSVNKVRQAVHVALEHAEQMDLIPTNLMRSIKRVYEQPEKIGFFESAELRVLFSKPWADFRVYAGAMLSVDTGLRLGELRGLIWQNVHTEKGYLDVLTNWQDGQGLKPPKWNDKRYGIPISDNALNALDMVREIAPFETQFVFFGEEPDRPMGRHSFQRVLKQAMAATGIPTNQPTNTSAKRTWHSLRHTAGTQTAGRVGLEAAQRLLGHTSSEMTLNYVHPTDADREKVRASQNAVWTVVDGAQD